MTSKRFGFTLLSVVCLILVTTVSASPSSADEVTCGQTIMLDTLLTHDIGPCSLGVVIAASNITFDLGGHRIFGMPSAGPGVLVQGGHGVRIRNGTVSDFGVGVAIVGGQENVVTGIQAVNNVGGYGIGAVMSFSNTITGNRVAQNGPRGGIAVFGTLGPGSGPVGNIVRGNTVENNAAPGIFLGGFARGNVVSGNRVTGNSSDGIQLQFPTAANQITGNLVAGNGFVASDRRGDGIFVGRDAFEGPPGGAPEGDQVEANTVLANAANGIHVNSHNNTIRSNRTASNGQLAGPPLAFDLLDSTQGNSCDNNTWSANTFVTAFPPCTTAQ